MEKKTENIIHTKYHNWGLSHKMKWANASELIVVPKCEIQIMMFELDLDLFVSLTVFQHDVNLRTRNLRIGPGSRRVYLEKRNFCPIAVVRQR